MQWTSASRRLWRTDLNFVGEYCFPGWRSRSKIFLIFSNRPIPRVFALCDPASLAIGIFPLARSLGPLQRRETLVHECCHLKTTGLHTGMWKRAMKTAGGHAKLAGQARLGTMIAYDVALYDRRDVSADDVERQLTLIMRHLTDVSYSNVRRHLADWAGWPVTAFTLHFPWLREAWRSSLSASVK